MEKKVPLSERVQSIRQQIGAEYTRPPKEKLGEYISALASNDDAKRYLEVERGLSTETIEHFKLGYDSVRDAIAIPIFKKDELINFKYRLINPGDKPKYSSERNAETWIYNEDGIQRGLSKGGILIVEGEFDLMSAWQAGVQNVVSPASGKDSYGTWLEYLDNIPRVYVAYDNDKPGKETAIKLAERLGSEKCLEVVYPDGIKDANEYFKSHTREEFLLLIKQSKPFYTHQFKGLGDVIKSIREKKDDLIQLTHMPGVKIEKDWLIVISGVTNVGKTGYILNLADELTLKGIPTLILPFERGVDSVGSRFLQVKFNMDINDFSMQNDEEWEKTIEKCLDLPAYLSVPNIQDVSSVIIKSKKIFNTKVVIIDHLDYLIRNVQGNKEAAIGDMLKELKRVAMEHGIIMLVVSHLRKMEAPGGWKTPRKPSLDDLKGSSSLSQDPETVVMLSSNEQDTITVDILKNKGEMSSATYTVNNRTGRIIGIKDDF